jgi:hypothetical protein
MIVLYKVVVNPNAYPDTLHDGMCLDEFRARDRWHVTQDDAEAACRKACELIGERPRPGIQHQRPIPVAVFEVQFLDALATVRRDWTGFHEVSRLRQFADGSWAQDGVVSRQVEEGIRKAMAFLQKPEYYADDNVTEAFKTLRGLVGEPAKQGKGG